MSNVGSKEIALCEDRAANVFILRQASVKSDQFKIRRLCECSQVSVVPDLWGKRFVLRVAPPERFDAVRLVCEDNVGVVVKIVVSLPRLFQRERLACHYLRRRRQPQEALLCHTAEAATLGLGTQKPCCRPRVVLMAVKSQRQPHVDVKKMHLARSGSRQCGRWSARRFRAARFLSTGDAPACESEKCARSGRPGTKRARRPLPAAMLRPRVRLRRSELGRERPYLNYPPPPTPNQVCTPRSPFTRASA